MTTTARLALLASVLAAAASDALPLDAGEANPSLSTLGLDAAFGRRGEVRSIGRGRRRLVAMGRVAVDGDGRVIVVGNLPAVRLSRSLRRTPAAVARLLADGRIDRTFAGGVAVLPVQGDGGGGLAVDSQDRVVVCGDFTGLSDPSRHYAAVRLLPDGRLDPTFSGDGLADFDPSIASSLRDVQISPFDGAITLVGSRNGIISSVADVGVLVHLTAAGGLDSAFGAGGFLTFAPGDAVGGMAVDAQGRIVVSVGRETRRYLADGTRDNAFGVGGVLRGPSGGLVAGRFVRIDATGRILVFGAEQFDPGGFVLRFLFDGTIDPTFSGDGRALIHGPRSGIANAALITPAGDRFATAGGEFYPAPRSAWFLHEIDTDAPGALRAYSFADPHASTRVQMQFLDAAFAPDGASCYAVGQRGVTGARGATSYTSVLRRIALRPLKDNPLPDLTVAWENMPDIGYLGRVQIRNVGSADSASASVRLYLSDDDRLDPSDFLVTAVETGALTAGASTVRDVPHTQLGGWPGFTGTTGKRLIAVVNEAPDVLESDRADNVAVSDPLQ